MLSHAISHPDLKSENFPHRYIEREIFKEEINKKIILVSGVSYAQLLNRSRNSIRYTFGVSKFLDVSCCTPQGVSDGWLWLHHDLQDRSDRLTDSNAVCCRFATESHPWIINDYFLPSQKSQKRLASHEAPLIASLSRVKSPQLKFEANYVFDPKPSSNIWTAKSACPKRSQWASNE